MPPNDGPEWPAPVDRAILAELRERGPDYLPLVANRRGLHLGLVRRRARRLVEGGHVEEVSEEGVYRLTDRGVEVLGATRDDEGAVRRSPGADE